MIGRAIQAEIYTEWHRGPRWIFGSAVKAYLDCVNHGNLGPRILVHTLLAGFVFSFSKIFWDCAFVAEFILTEGSYPVALPGYGDRGYPAV